MLMKEPEVQIARPTITTSVGYALIYAGKQVLKSHVKGRRYHISTGELSALLHKPMIEQYILYDGTIEYTDFSTFKRIIDEDWTRALPFKRESFDCDNYSTAFASHVNEIFELNCVGVVSGVVKDVNTGEIKACHAWNVFIAQADVGPKLYIYEPQAGILTDYEHSRFGNLLYEPNTIVWW